MDVKSIHQRAGDAVAIGADFSIGAGARSSIVTEVAAGAWVHGADDHGGCRVADIEHGAADPDEPLFERLSHRLQDIATKLGEFVQEKDAAVSQ